MNPVSCFTATRMLAKAAQLTTNSNQLRDLSLRVTEKERLFPSPKLWERVRVRVYTFLYEPEIRDYYQRRIAEGKSNMSTLNIVRYKLVHRVFAVVKRQSPYVVLNQYTA